MTEHVITYKGLAVLLEGALERHVGDEELRGKIESTISTLRNMPYPEAMATPFVRQSVKMILDSVVFAHKAAELARSSDVELADSLKKGG